MKTTFISSTPALNATVSLSAGTINGSVAIPNLTIGTQYSLSAKTADAFGNVSEAATVNFTVNSGGIQNAFVTSTCTAQLNCSGVLSFDEPATSGNLKAGPTTVTVSDPSGNTIFTTTVASPAATGNTVTITPTLASNTKYSVKISTNGSTSSGVVNFSPSFIYSNGAYVYNTNFDLQGTSAPYKSTWQNDFQKLQLTDLYIDTNYAYLNVNYPSAGSLSDSDYYNQYVDGAVDNTTNNPNCTSLGTYALTYSSYVNGTFGIDVAGKFTNPGTCVSQSATNQSYKQWQLNNGQGIRVMTLIETPEALFGTDATPKTGDAVSSTTIDHLAYSVARAIYADPYADGVTFDVEFNLPAVTVANEYGYWFEFFSDLTKYMHNMVPSNSEQKYLSIFANDAVMTEVKNGNQNLYTLLSSNTTNNPNCAADKCYVIVPRYDFSGINPWNNFDTLQSLDQLVNSSSTKESFSYQAASGLSYTTGSLLSNLLTNGDYFQFAFAASGSWSTTPAIYIVRLDPVSANQIQSNENVSINGCSGGPGAPTGCVQYIGQWDDQSNETTQDEYVCDSLLAFKMVETGAATDADSLCRYVGDSDPVGANGVWNTYVNDPTYSSDIKKYFMGMAMYQISDQQVDINYCSLDNRFSGIDCEVSAPMDMNQMSETTDALWNWSNITTMINTWTSTVIKPQPVVTS